MRAQADLSIKVGYSRRINDNPYVEKGLLRVVIKGIVNFGLKIL